MEKTHSTSYFLRMEINGLSRLYNVDKLEHQVSASQNPSKPSVIWNAIIRNEVLGCPYDDPDDFGE